MCVFHFFKEKNQRNEIFHLQTHTQTPQIWWTNPNKVEDETIVLIIVERFQLYIYRFVYLLWYCELLLKRWTMRMVAPLKSDYYCCGWFFFLHSFASCCFLFFCPVGKIVKREENSCGERRENKGVKKRRQWINHDMNHKQNRSALDYEFF